MSKKSFSRENEEKKELKTRIENEVPENRMQGDQQQQPSADALDVKTPSSSFQTKEDKGKGSQVKVEAISDVLTGSSSSTGMGINAGGRGVSGTAGGVLGANNSTPIAGKSRSETRFGKKLDRLATKLNYTPSEQALIAVDESKPLADAASDDQGYNGTYRNTFARSQKKAGAVPGSLMFQRSVDLILKDKLYFVEGQQVYQTGDVPSSYNPSHTCTGVGTRGFTSRPITYRTGNFLHRGLHFGLDSDGEVLYFYADVDNLMTGSVTPEEANMLSAHRLIKSNVAELDRIQMDAKAGDEKADIWTPLARAIDEPTQASFYMSSVEADTGAYVHLAYSKACANFAYQLNRAPKDGMSIVGPAIEQAMGWRSNYTCGNDYTVAHPTLQSCFSSACYDLGDPTLLIEAYDSKGKYNNKADLLLQPRGWRMHLQTADNNMDAFRVPSEYVNVFCGEEVFSTIDHEYDPLLPVCMTDKANLVLTHNLNEQCGFWKNAAGKFHVEFTADTIREDYAYSEVVIADLVALETMGYQHIKIAVKVSDGNGLVYEDGVISLRPDLIAGSKDIAIDIIPLFNGEDTPEGYTTIVNERPWDIATHSIVFHCPKQTGTISDVVEKRTKIDVDFRNGGVYSYAYSDLRNNYIVDVKHPLIFGLIAYLEESIGSKIYSLLGSKKELYIPLIFSTQYMTLAQIIICAATPWIQRVRINSMKDVFYYQDNTGSYPYSQLVALKDVPFKSFRNFGYTDYDHPLEARVMNPVNAIEWTMPEFFWKIADNTYVLPWYFNEVDLKTDGTVDPDAANMSMPSIRSGVRLAGLDAFYGMSEKDIRLSLDRIGKRILGRGVFSDTKYAYKYGRTTDGQVVVTLSEDYVNQGIPMLEIIGAYRELGLSMDAPLGLLTCDPADQGLKDILVDDGTATSYRIKVWANSQAAEHPDILAQDDVNITRAANYSQVWRELCANNATTNTDLNGLVFGMSDDEATYRPFAVLGSGEQVDSATFAVSVESYQRSVYTRLQFLPFVISPFDSNYTGQVPHDIYDVAYFFGLAGFRASDYRESVYNREKEVINQGMLFIHDPWIEASPIMKGASSATGLKETKGYEIRS